MLIVLDSGPVGLFVHPLGSRQSDSLTAWLESMILAGHTMGLPEIVDYESRREILRQRNVRSLRKLEMLAASIDYLPITTEVMRRAAELWAFARQRGKPTSADTTIDIDVILAAQAMLYGEERREEAVIATSNVRHLSRFTAARPWQDIIG